LVFHIVFQPILRKKEGKVTGTGQLNQKVAIREEIIRVGLKNGNWSAAVLLPVRFVGPYLTARFGDARNGPPRAQPKSLVAGQFRFFRQTLRKMMVKIG